MNQTYKNLRAILQKHKENMPIKVTAELLAEIDEAEAECCEWKVLHEKCFIQNPHTKRMFSNEPSMKNVYCNTCGKPIKIAEVK